MLLEKIEKIITNKLAESGFEIVRVRLKAGKVLELMIERNDQKSITVAECAKVSRQVSYLLDSEDSIMEKYTLEVSSPGIDRPLVREKDFTRFLGFQIKVETSRMYDGRKNFKGVLQNTQNHLVGLVDFFGRKWEISFAVIRKANLISDQKGKLLKGLMKNG